MPTRNLLYAKSLPINDDISLNIPTIGEVLEQEDNYFGIVSTITSTPYDMMVQLDDIGVDFSTIDDYQLFLLTFNGLKASDTSLIFGDFDFSGFELMQNVQNGTLVMHDQNRNVTIDEGIFRLICDGIRKIHHLKRVNKKPGNLEAKKYMIQRARKKQARRKKRMEDSSLESTIVALVNTEQFSYTYETVRDMSIYQFYESLHQIIWKVDYDNKMHGVYAGTVSTKGMSQDEFNWLVHK